MDEEHTLTSALSPASSFIHRLRLGVPVKGGRVKQVDARGECGFDGGDALGLVDGLKMRDGWRKRMRKNGRARWG
jgi:hypothetical protein